MPIPDWMNEPHRRLNPLTGDWVLVSPHRTQRPWQGQVDAVPLLAGQSYDPACYLCPGNGRAGGKINPVYTETFVFENDFAALKPETGADATDDGCLLVARAESGICRVVCFSPDHSLTLSRMSLPAIERVVATWTGQYLELGARPDIQSVQIFENRGEMMGASNPHPHGQIWANRTLPNELAKEAAAQQAYHDAHASCLLCDYLTRERRDGVRLLAENEWFTALVPFWAIWPFETMVLSRRHLSALDGLPAEGAAALASLLRRLTSRYDNLFAAPFPYTMGLHQRPTDGAPHPGFHFHAHFYPPLLRSATVKKFMVGYEMLAGPQRDITPESAAARLRECAETAG